MKLRWLAFVCMLSGGVGDFSVYQVMAKAPATAKIAFSANRDGNREIYLMHPDGTQQVNISQHRADDVDPTWSPTGTQLLFVSNRDGIHDLYLMDADGANVRRVFGKSAHRAQPTWAPDGKQIAYRRRARGESYLYLATLESEQETRVAIGHSPAWSPDGTEIAFLTGEAERVQLSFLNVRTRTQRVFFPKPAVPSWMTSPAWSPSGDKLAFSWLHQVPLKDFLDTETIYHVNRDGTGLRQIVAAAGPRAVAPIWSPQGDVLLYQQHDGNAPWSAQIFKVALADGETEQLTHIGIWNSPGAWFDPAYALPVQPHVSLLTMTWGQLKTSFLKNR